LRKFIYYFMWSRYPKFEDPLFQSTLSSVKRDIDTGRWHSKYLPTVDANLRIST
jgi:hypothetical protein